MPNPKLQQGIVNIQNQDTQTTPVVKPGRSQYSSENPYQQNLQQPAQPEKWYAGDQPTSREMLGKIYSIYQEDKDYGQKLLNNFHMEQQNPASAYYNAYSQTTNKAVQNLASYGIDASQINNAWYAANPGWDSYLSFNGTTNTPSKPGKKASIQEKIAYEIYQYGKADADTKAAKTEWDAMRQELMYWAARDDEVRFLLEGIDDRLVVVESCAGEKRLLDVELCHLLLETGKVKVEPRPRPEVSDMRMCVNNLHGYPFTTYYIIVPCAAANGKPISIKALRHRSCAQRNIREWRRQKSCQPKIVARRSARRARPVSARPS